MEIRNTIDLITALKMLIEEQSENRVAPVRIESHGGFTVRKIYIADNDAHWPDGYCIIETD